MGQLLPGEQQVEVVALDTLSIYSRGRASNRKRIRRHSIKEERAREETEGGHKEQRNIQSSARARAGSLSDCSRVVRPTPPSAVFGVHNWS